MYLIVTKDITNRCPSQSGRNRILFRQDQVQIKPCAHACIDFPEVLKHVYMFNSPVSAFGHGRGFDLQLVPEHNALAAYCSAGQRTR